MICPSCECENLQGADECAWCMLALAEFDRPAPGDRVERSLMGDAVRSLGPTPALTIPAFMSVRAAARLMAEEDIGAVLVEEGTGLVGIFTERDLLVKVDLASAAEMARPVSDFMTRRPETVGETDPLAFALHRMDCGGYRHLPVMRGRDLVGIVSVRDMLGHIIRMCK